jgi:uncharacterized protein
MNEPPLRRTARDVYARVTERPRAVLAASAVVVLAFAAFLPRLHQDSRVEAFLPPDEAVLALREQVQQRFGMADPMAILVVNDGPAGIFTLHTLGLVQRLSEAVQQVPGVDPQAVTSLATVRVAELSDEGTALVTVIDPHHLERGDFNTARTLVERHEVLHGLVAGDRRSTLIVVERFDSADGTRIYEELAGIAAAAELSGGEKLHVAGHGALTATLGEYIDSDTRVLYVAVTIVIGMVLALAFRTVAGVALPLVLIGATLAVCMGSMAMATAPFTVISSALPVVISALVVTDGLHILSLYYQYQAERPEASARELVIDAMSEIWRPCVGARVTDIAGFAGLYLGTEMPPMKTFGIFGSIAILAEMVLALLVYPCLLVVARPRPSPVFNVEARSLSVAAARGFIDRVSSMVTRHSMAVLAGGAIVVLAGLSGMGRLVVNDSWVGNFDAGSPVRIATEEMERRHGILTDLDLIIDAGSPEAMIEPDALRSIDVLEQKLAALPFVTGVHSITEVFRGIAGPSAAAKPAGDWLPDSRDVAAQTLLVADPDTVRRWLDDDQQRALVRLHTRARDYLSERQLLTALDRLLDDAFAESPMTVSVGGMVAIGAAWVGSVGSFHLLSAAMSVGFCWLQMMAGFRSITLGSLAIVPMLAAMLLMYAVMGWAGIPLGIGTSMFAALAIGTGVDFAIHTVDRFLVLRERGVATLGDAMSEILPTTGRTIVYSAAAIIFGFSVLCVSSIPAVRSLGVLVTVSVVASLAATFTVLPALIHVFRPRKLVGAGH